MEAAKDAGVTVVSLPLVNQWTQVSHLELLGAHMCHPLSHPFQSWKIKLRNALGIGHVCF